MTDGHLKKVVDHLRQAIKTEGDSDALLLERYLADHCEIAFRELLDRHGPMVLGVCHRWLGGPHDAEDAFQAVFLVLARKAGSIHPPDAVGRWLYGTAVRTARKAKHRRDRRERQQAILMRWQAEPSQLLADPVDWLPMLDEELNRLADKHRLPIILCDLLGRSRQEAASELGIAEGTLSSRLARAREQLRDRLIRRGVIPATAIGVLNSSINLYAEVPNSLSASTIHACAGTATVTANGLAEGVIRSMFINKLQKALVFPSVVAVLGMIGWGVDSRLTAEPHPTAAAETLVAANQDSKKDADEKPKLKTTSNDRSQRWTIIFKTNSGVDYLKQLATLEATVVIPQAPNWKTTRIFTDLNKPNPGKPFVNEELPKMYFTDNDAASATKVAEALGLDYKPPFIITYFPKKTEEKLAELETKFRNRKADEIFSTTFRVVENKGVYEIRVTEQVEAKK